MTQAHTDAMLELVKEALEDLKALDIKVIDIKGRANFADIMVFASGSSNRHVKSIAQSVVEKTKHADMPPLGVEGEDIGEWVLVDLGDVVVHIMRPDTREFYDIERLWTEHDAHVL